MDKERLTREAVQAVVLAGGQGKRVGFQQKGLLPFQGKPLIEWVLSSLHAQGLSVSINANQPQAYQAYGEVFADSQTGFLGPLSGMSTAFERLSADWLLFVPCDNPYPPANLFEGLQNGFDVEPNPIVVAYEGEQIQPLYCLVHRDCALEMQRALTQGHLSVRRWILERPHTRVVFDVSPQSGFLNLNRMSDTVE